jgi:hypothetical protein
MGISICSSVKRELKGEMTWSVGVPAAPPAPSPQCSHSPKPGPGEKLGEGESHSNGLTRGPGDGGELHERRLGHHEAESEGVRELPEEMDSEGEEEGEGQGGRDGALGSEGEGGEGESRRRDQGSGVGRTTGQSAGVATRMCPDG